MTIPLSFPGSTRYHAEHFEDGKAIVCHFGSQDFFVTMTCNPNWPDIKEAGCVISNDNEFLREQSSQDHPDIIAGIAKRKFGEIINDLDKKKRILGEVVVNMYII